MVIRKFLPIRLSKAGDAAKKAAKKAGGALVKKGKETIADKIRKKDMGKWSQGIKNAPKSSESETKAKPYFDYMSDPDDQNAKNAQTKPRPRRQPQPRAVVVSGRKEKKTED